jgi:hypothetical protein
MKKTFLKIVLALFTSVLVFAFFNACKKETDKMIPPILEFKTGAGYTSSNATVPVSTPVKVGIHAEKTEGEDFLNTFTVSHSYDGGATTQDSTRGLIEAEHDDFDEDINFTTRSTAGTEAYYFTITNRDGLIVSDTLTLTVN